MTASKSCVHQKGPLLEGHARCTPLPHSNPIISNNSNNSSSAPSSSSSANRPPNNPDNPDESPHSYSSQLEEKEQDSEMNEQNDEAPHPGAEIDDANLQPNVIKKQLQHDLSNRGSWPLKPNCSCEVLNSPGITKWREYRWVVQSYVDRSSKLCESKIQVMQDVTGSRQEFLATYKRKLLEWLPHMQHKRWDNMWQRNRKQ